MMKGLHNGLLRRACRLWLHWDAHIRSILNLTRYAEGFEVSGVADEELFSQWQEMKRNSIRSWESYVGQSVLGVDEAVDGVADDGELGELDDVLSSGSSDSDSHGDTPNA